ncbi:MAG: hypothetical protein I3273_04735 [Candidatus Moeniiplasma glomeromycotorum]|nr:hypothetical protein [Candidatus Moeniiplasma glomeromycotorum]MCE8169399.1 hypothetical protein [Candidatus Moeniiplasma glomeromycotorum]
MATTKLTNFEVRKLTDRNLQEYFMIINNDNRDEVYFCFQTRVKEGWDILNKSPLPINIEIEYEENEQNGRIYKRATSLYTDDDIIV